MYKYMHHAKYQWPVLWPYMNMIVMNHDQNVSWDFYYKNKYYTNDNHITIFNLYASEIQDTL